MAYNILLLPVDDVTNICSRDQLQCRQTQLEI